MKNSPVLPREPDLLLLYSAGVNVGLHTIDLRRCRCRLGLGEETSPRSTFCVERPDESWFCPRAASGPAPLVPPRDKCVQLLSAQVVSGEPPRVENVFTETDNRHRKMSSDDPAVRGGGVVLGPLRR